MPIDRIEDGDTVHFDHVWGKVEVLRKGAFVATSPRPGHVRQEGFGTVVGYSKDGNTLIVKSGGKRLRVPLEHARLHQKGAEQPGLF